MSHIEFTVAIGVRAPITPGEYVVRNRLLRVSYPERVTLPIGDVDMPRSLSTLFVVSWSEEQDVTAARLRSGGHEQHLPIYDVLETISELLLAFKLVRVGHYDGRGVRTVGLGDTLLYYSSVDGVRTGPLNTGLKNYPENSAWPDVTTPKDYGTTALAGPHIGVSTHPLARRYVRCFELIEHGFYTEAFIVAFALLDDTVQNGLRGLMAARALSADEQQRLTRSIKENRLNTFLGPLLKFATGIDLGQHWPDYAKAMKWINEIRNNIAHNAQAIDYATAANGIFTCMKLLVVLHEQKVVEADIPVHLFRHAKICAAWTANPRSWVPTGALAESMDLRS